MNNALLYLGGLLVVALAALFAVPHFVDWNGYRGVFEEEASKVLGRDVRVGGAVNVRFLPTPYVRFEKVRLADPTGQTGEPFVRVDSFTMRLSGPGLLRGVLEANEIELQRPVLSLALNGSGGGNWSNVQIKPGALPFVPQDVALHSVKVIDGSVALYNAESQPIAHAESVNGEFSAEALKGPFKFKGQANWSGEARDIKFATTVPEADGSFRIKANIRAKTSATTYMLDGRVEDLSGKPKLTGELTGKLPLADAGPAAAPQAGNAPASLPASLPGSVQGSVETVLDLKSRIEADTSGAKVEDLVLALDNATEPQLITGSATAVWGKEQRLDISLNSKWLDLDRLSGAGQDGATFVKVKRLGLSTLRSLAGDGDGTAAAKIVVDQVKLGGETAGGMKIDAERRGGSVRLTELRAGLPGGSRLELSGDLKDDNGKVHFSGAGFVRGTNLARLVTWAAKSGTDLDIKADGAFSAEGRVLVDDARFELTEVAADIGGRPFTGDVVVSGERQRKVAVTLEAARLDSSELFPQTSRALEDSLRKAFGFGAVAEAAGAASSGADAAKATSAAASDVSIRILAGELKHGNQVFRNVDATLGLDGGNIRIPSAKFTTGAGLVASIEAHVDHAATEPKGTLAYDLVARTHAAVADFATISGLSSVVDPARLAKLGSAKLAGLVRLGAREASTVDVTFDGSVELANLAGNAEFDRGLQSWRSAPSRIRVTARAPALAPMLAAFGVDAGAATPPGPHEAELVFVSTGVLASGVAALVDVSAPGFEAAYNGRVVLPDNAPASYAGVLQFKADDALDVVAAAGISAVKGLAGVPVEGRIDVSREGNEWRAASRQLLASGSKLRGGVQYALNGPGPASFTGDIQADTVTLAGLLAVIMDKSSEAADASAAVWPSTTFAMESLLGSGAGSGAATGDLRLRFDTFKLQDGMSARDGSFKIALAPGRASISELTGRAAGGVLGGSVQLAKAATGVTLTSDIKIDGADLVQLGSSARGKANLQFTATGAAQSPSGLMSTLSGAGSVALEGARLPVPATAMGTNIVSSVLAGKLANEAEDLAGSLRSTVAIAATDLGSRTVPFTIANGIAKFEPITLESADGSATGITVIDLTSMAVDSAWRLAAFVPPLPPPAEALPGWVTPPVKGPLPPASVVFTGQLADLKNLAVNIDTADMQRELAVRIVERNLEELERLKLQDQNRIRLEQERRQAIEAERAAAVAAAAAAKAAAAPPPVSVPVPGQAPAAALPPVIPESAATTVSPTEFSPPAASPSAGAQSITITVEPIPPPPGSNEPQPVAPAQAVPAPVVPAGERPAAVNPRPQPARATPPRPAPARRTTSDEVMRSLGGFP